MNDSIKNIYDEMVIPMTARQLLSQLSMIVKDWDEEDPELRGKMAMIDPDAPIITQFGEYGFEVASSGGDLGIEGFVLMLKSRPAYEWRGLAPRKDDK